MVTDELWTFSPPDRSENGPCLCVELPLVSHGRGG